MKRRGTLLMIVALLGTLFPTMAASAASVQRTMKRQRVAIEVKVPLNARTGTFVLDALTPGQLKSDIGPITITSGPTPVFGGRIIGGQSVDRFRGTDTLSGKRGTLVIRLQVGFVSAGNGYQVGTGTWSVVSGTGAYARLAGGGRSAFVRPPVPPGRFGFSRHEGFVSMR